MQPEPQPIVVPPTRPKGLGRAEMAAVISAAIATAFAIAIVALAFTTFTLPPVCDGGGTACGEYVRLSTQSSGTNWTLTTTFVSRSGLSYSTTTFKIYDGSGIPKSTNVLSNITASPTTGLCSSWAVKKVCYIPGASGQGEIREGDRIVADKATYPDNYRWELLSPTTVLAHGVFR